LDTSTPGAKNSVPADQQLTLMDNQSVTPSFQATPSSRAKRGKVPIISDACLRRSEHIHSLHIGFKSSPCKSQNCLGCSADPPNSSCLCSSRFGCYLLSDRSKLLNQREDEC
jgi:hypothetical protein